MPPCNPVFVLVMNSLSATRRATLAVAVTHQVPMHTIVAKPFLERGGLQSSSHSILGRTLPKAYFLFLHFSSSRFGISLQVDFQMVRQSAQRPRAQATDCLVRPSAQGLEFPMVIQYPVTKKLTQGWLHALTGGA